MRLPIRARVKTTVMVPVDPENSDHKEYLEQGFAPETTYIDGFYVEPMSLMDAKEGVVMGDGAYVEFWEDRGDYYTVSFVDPVHIIIDAKEVRNYISKLHSTYNGR